MTTLFAILRSALGTGPLSSPVSLTPREWRRLFTAACNNQVSALVYNELKTAGCDMPSDVRSAWEQVYQFCKERFDAQLLSLTRLSSLLEGEGVRMMVLKGMGIAVTYPKPRLRECGDIDIFCYGDYDKVNDFIISSGIDKEARETEEKHFGFIVGGIEVENHRKFCTENNHANRLMGKVLMELSAETPIVDPRLPFVSFPSAQMGALHLISHTLMHLWWSGITLRHLCDVTIYFRHYRDSLDLGQLQSVLREAGVEKSAALLLGICNDLLGLGYDLSGWDRYGREAADKVLHSIFHPMRDSSTTPDPVLKFVRKVGMHRFRAGLYPIVYGEKYPERFIDSFVFLKPLLRRTS